MVQSKMLCLLSRLLGSLHPCLLFVTSSEPDLAVHLGDETEVLHESQSKALHCCTMLSGLSPKGIVGLEPAEHRSHP